MELKVFFQFSVDGTSSHPASPGRPVYPLPRGRDP